MGQHTALMGTSWAEQTVSGGRSLVVPGRSCHAASPAAVARGSSSGKQHGSMGSQGPAGRCAASARAARAGRRLCAGGCRRGPRGRSTRCSRASLSPAWRPTSGAPVRFCLFTDFATDLAVFACCPLRSAQACLPAGRCAAGGRRMPGLGQARVLLRLGCLLPGDSLAPEGRYVERDACDTAHGAGQQCGAGSEQAAACLLPRV